MNGAVKKGCSPNNSGNGFGEEVTVEVVDNWGQTQSFLRLFL